MLKKTVSVCMVLAVLLSLFAGCAGTKKPVLERGASVMENTSIGFSHFDDALIAALLDDGFAEKSFTVSPLSFRAALVLAAAGASDTTRDELFSVLGVSSMQELNEWYAEVGSGVAAFDEYFSGYDAEERADAAYQIVNAVFENGSLPGAFLPEYLDLIGDTYQADAFSETAERLTAAINAWVKEKTNGLIPQIIDDASDCDAVLANAVYLKAGWLKPFERSELQDFTDLHGNILQKDFICSQASYRYYADEDCQLVIVPLQGNLKIAFVLGGAENFREKLRKAEETQVLVTIPKFELETGYQDEELCAFLRNAGCASMFGADADFSGMFSEQLHVSDIVQKARVSLDENGIEAAAATIIALTKGIHIVKEEPTAFTADRAFSFAIYAGTEEAPQLLFYGQVVD